MGCGASTKEHGPPTALGAPSGPCGPVEAKVRKCPNVVVKAIGGKSYYVLQQAFALVRHGDRMDHTPGWKTHPERKAYPNDTPLTDPGHRHATAAGDSLKKSGKPYSLIVASPYYRCVQTASRIAQVLKLPIHLDLDLGEIFDAVSMKGDIKGKPQHRSVDVLEDCLKTDFNDVEYIRDEAGSIKVEGNLQTFPEDFDAARMRYCYKVQKLVQRAAAELMSLVIVTHGDALAAVAGLLREDWQILEVPYTAWVLCSREVKLLEVGTETLVEDPIYEHPDEWSIELSKGFKYKTIPQCELQQAHIKHNEEMVLMKSQAANIKCDYVLDDDQVEQFKAALSHLGADQRDAKPLLRKVASSHHLAKDRTNRIGCSPPMEETDTRKRSK